MEKKTLGVALTKVLCPICAKQIDGDIIMNTLLTESMAKKVEELNGKTLGWSDKACPECIAMIKIGIVFIGAVKAKSVVGQHPYRSGNLWCITDEAAKNILGEIPASRSAYIDVLDAQAMGFPDVKLDA